MESVFFGDFLLEFRVRRERVLQSSRKQCGVNLTVHQRRLFPLDGTAARAGHNCGRDHRSTMQSRPDLFGADTNAYWPGLQV